MTKIYAPNKSYTGRVAGISFANGEGELKKDDVGEERYEHLKGWFERKGYGVGKKSDAKEIRPAAGEEEHKALEDHSVEELKDLARQHSVAFSGLNKEQLVGALRDAGLSRGSEGPRT